MSVLISPPALRAGGAIAIVAPSGPFEDEQLKSGLARLSRYRTSVPDQLWSRRHGHFAANDEVRLRELQEAFDRPDLDAILIARGGYGLGRIVDELDLTGLRAHPKWVCGFSDATALHQRLLREGLLSIHGPNVTTLAGASEEDADLLFRLLAGAPPEPVGNLEVLVGGAVRGPLVGGNLTVLFCEAVAGRLSLPDGSVLFLEDVTETSYRIDRMLSSLERGGHLAPVAGVVLGEFTDCSPGKFGVETRDVLREACLRWGLPSAGGFPAGHGKRQHPFVHGRNCALADGVLTFG